MSEWKERKRDWERGRKRERYTDKERLTKRERDVLKKTFVMELVMEELWNMPKLVMEYWLWNSSLHLSQKTCSFVMWVNEFRNEFYFFPSLDTFTEYMNIKYV